MTAHGSSLSLRFRRRRFARFRALLDTLPRPVSVLDVGGTTRFWRDMEFVGQDGAAVTVLNRDSQPAEQGIAVVVGDATDLRAFADGAFDVVFSNSVIEHVGGADAQRRMADEVRRVGRRYFVQTPARGFPIEPHFRVPFFQYLPVAARVWLVRHVALGFYERTPDTERARRFVTGIRLLSRREVGELFPGARIERERVCGLTKSFIACGGW